MSCKYFDNCEHRSGWCRSDNMISTCTYGLNKIVAEHTIEKIELRKQIKKFQSERDFLTTLLTTAIHRLGEDIDFGKLGESHVGDNVYFIATTPISSAHPYVFNNQVERGTIVAIKVKTIKGHNDYKYVIKRERDKCCGTYSKVFKTKEEAENFIK